MYWNRENRGKFEICGRWLKKVIRNFRGWKSRNLSGKGKILKIFLRVWNFFENRGYISNRGKMHHGLRGDGRPCPQSCATCLRLLNFLNLRPRDFKPGPTAQWAETWPGILGWPKIISLKIFEPNIQVTCFEEKNQIFHPKFLIV